MRHRHHCDVGDCRIAMQRIFDFLRADILAPAHDNILFTAAHRQEIAKFDPSEITRAEEAVLIERIVRQRLIGIAQHHLRAANKDLSFRSEEHTSELQSLMRLSYAVFCLKKKNTTTQTIQ